MSDRIDEYHGAEAKVLTTDEVERWQEFLGDGIQFRRTLATTRALEKAEAELDSAMFARDRYANTIGLIESAVGFSGANPVEETIEHVRRLKAERDEAIARAEKAETKAAADAMRDWDSLRQEFEANVTTLRAEKAERERDEARAEVERRDALISRDGYEDMRQHAADLAQRLETAERERDAARATVAELVTALTGLERKFLDPRPGDPGGPCWCDYDRPRWMGHDDHCDAARDALAKAKGATNGTR